MNWKYVRHALVASAVVAATAGCAEERDPINRVQANALAKSFFVGEDLVNDADNPAFYANGTILDVGYGAQQDGLFSGFYSNDLSIIKWKIEDEHTLVGRLAYERIDGTDGKGAGQQINNGQVIYAFRIESHFDIRRSYNPSTGEEMNVVEENTSDRPWYQRQYMRVDWSRNLITDAYDFDILAMYGLFGGTTWEDVGYYISDPNHEHAPRFEPSEGYFDITTRAYATPGMLDISYLGWGLDKVPACWFDGDFAGGTGPGGNCNPVEVTIRHSFWKKQDRDYEPQHWDGYRFQAAGAFLKERYGFERNYGMSDSKWRRFIQRYNIWERSHYYEDPANMTGAVECYTSPGSQPDLDADGDGTADECAAVTAKAGPGSRCDTFSQKCTLPYRQRDIRPIVWYYTNDSDYRFFDATIWAQQEWDVAMKVAVQSARYAECVRTKGENCEAAVPVPTGQMTMMGDLVDIEREVDACRRGKGVWDHAACAEVVDAELQERGYEGLDYEAMRSIALMEDTVVLCHSPIHADDHPLCAPGKPRLPAGVTAHDCQVAMGKHGDDLALVGNADVIAQCNQAYTIRVGDVRHHLVNVVRSPETPSPWGFGPTYADPLTGEAVSASINVWSWPTDFISQGTVDVARFIAGDLDVSEVTDGSYIKDWVAAAENASGKGALGGMTRAEREERLVQALESVTRSLETGASPDLSNAPLRAGAKVPPELMAHAERIGEIRHVHAALDAQPTSSARYHARMRAAQGTATEAELTGKAMLQLAGVNDGKVASHLATQLASPLRMINNPSIQRELKHMRELGLAERGACMLDVDEFAPSPTSMIGISKQLEAKFGAFDADDGVDPKERIKRMQRYVGDMMHYAVIIHEMGHTFGYRHNFVSSSSAMHYRPQYWQLRTKNGAVTSECTDLANSEEEAEACVGPRYFDPITTEEQENLIHMWMHSSVMDYAGDYAQDMLGLGAYDFHAARMFYGDIATVYADDDLKRGTPLSGALHQTIMDSFGGIVGLSYQSAPRTNDSANIIHYSQINNVYRVIDNCQPIDPEVFRPSWWDTERHGEWNPLLDGHLVQVDGQYSRCFQRRVSFADWDELRLENDDPNNPNDNQPTGRTGPSIDQFDRTRVPYGFATDRWADLGNVAVYRHDNGADPYELFEFFITEQELRHIFDNYRRDRHGFSVRSAANRILGRYNMKMRDGAKGMTLIKNNISAVALDEGLEPGGFLSLYVTYWGWDDILLASGMAFDHFARQIQRPRSGVHLDPRSTGGSLTIPYVADDFSTAFDMLVPDGAQGFWNTVGIGGKLVENTLASDTGEYDAYYTMNAGSYYDKAWAPMLFTESVDNFISDSLDDFVDARYRAVSIADLFPDGFRRLLANNLTGDEWIKGAHVAANTLGRAELDPAGFPARPIGWTTWWTEQPQVCFPGVGTQICTNFAQDNAPFEPDAPAFTRPLESQVGWEQQKFLIAMTLLYLPENQKQRWLDMMGIWSLGDDTDPGFANRIELHVPTGDVYIARTYGTEEICFEECKTVQRGIGARILEYANELLQAAYVTTPVTVNGTTWYEPVIQDGAPIVRFDSGLTWINGDGFIIPPPPDCTADPDPNDADYSTFLGCRCENNAACLALEDYISVPDFMRQSMRDFKMAHPSMKGIY